MEISALKAQLRADEGERLKVYIDTVGVPTIGVGRNLKDRGISAVESDFLLTNDIQAVQADLNSMLPWWVGLSDNRQLVLANMCFNLGIGGLLGFRNMLACAKSGDWFGAAKEMRDSHWATQVGARAERLALLMERG